MVDVLRQEVYLASFAARVCSRSSVGERLRCLRILSSRRSGKGRALSCRIQGGAGGGVKKESAGKKAGLFSLCFVFAPTRRAVAAAVIAAASGEGSGANRV